MQAPRRITTIAASLAAAATVLTVSLSQAQEVNPAHEKVAGSCGIESVYTAGYLVAAAGIEDCEILRKIERATDLFFKAECKLLEARQRAADPRSYGAANELVDRAQSDLAEASDIFFEISEKMDGDFALEETEQSELANAILKIYGYDAPQYYSGAFWIMGDVTATAAEQLSDLRFGEDGNVSYALDNMYSLTGAMMRPGGVFRAIAALLGQAVA